MNFRVDKNFRKEWSRREASGYANWRASASAVIAMARRHAAFLLRYHHGAFGGYVLRCDTLSAPVPPGWRSFHWSGWKDGFYCD